MDITKEEEATLLQACDTAQWLMIECEARIDDVFKKEGFAKQNPAILAAFMQVAMQDYTLLKKGHKKEKKKEKKSGTPTVVSGGRAENKHGF